MSVTYCIRLGVLAHKFELVYNTPLKPPQEREE